MWVGRTRHSFCCGHKNAKGPFRRPLQGNSPGEYFKLLQNLMSSGVRFHYDSFPRDTGTETHGAASVSTHIQRIYTHALRIDSCLEIGFRKYSKMIYWRSSWAEGIHRRSFPGTHWFSLRISTCLWKDLKYYIAFKILFSHSIGKGCFLNIYHHWFVYVFLGSWDTIIHKRVENIASGIWTRGRFCFSISTQF